MTNKAAWIVTVSSELLNFGTYRNNLVAAFINDGIVSTGIHLFWASGIGSATGDHWAQVTLTLIF